MAVGVALAVGVLVVGLIAAYMLRPQMEGTDMSPATLESFQVTTTDEGSVVPWCAGEVRIKTNLIWYGGLRSEAITQDVGGKGGGDEVTTGYQYWMDLWKSLCLGGGIYGTVTVEGLYVGDRPVNLANLTYEFNDGTQSTAPTEPGEDAAALKSVAHIFFPQYNLGENAAFVPTFHFEIKVLSAAPLTYANLSNGVNPAAKVYDILVAAGSSISDFDMDSFQDAADYWHSMGYGLNLSYSSQKATSEWISQIFTYVDGVLRKDDEDRWFLQANTPTDPSVGTFYKEDLIDFSLTRRSWTETYNDFRANFTSKEHSYTRRTIRAYNGANMRLLGYKRQRTIDLTAYIDITTASKRLGEIMRRESYPEAQISFSTFLDFEAECHVGRVITINHDEYGIANASFRITSREINENDDNKLDFKAMQVVESLWDDTYVDGGSPSWTTPTYITPAVPLAQDIFEMPFNSQYGTGPSYLLLCARSGIETAFTILTSVTGVDYATYGVGDIFSQRGTLAAAYPDSLETDSIDDTIGIEYTPLNEDPVFGTISRTNLFHDRRVAIIDGKEMVSFQTVTYNVGGTITLTGVVRGILGTPISSHTSGRKIWITEIVAGRNFFTDIASGGLFYAKFLPRLGSEIVAASSVSAITHTVTGIGSEQGPPCTLHAVRSGTTVTVTIYPRDRVTPTGQGAGVKIADSSQDPSFYSDGSSQNADIPWEYTVGGGSPVLTYKYVFAITQAGAFYLDVSRNTETEYTRLLVGASDGEYVGPELVD